jgi:hypothetical protein
MSTASENLPTAATSQPPAKQTTMNALKPSPETPVQNLPTVRSGFDSLQAFELMQRGAKLLMASSLVPDNYKNNLPNCVIALNIAQRIGADPLLVMQNLYVVYGRPAWSAQFMIACFNQCGRFASIRYRWTGAEGKDDWGCQAYSKELATGDVITGPLITITTAKREGWYEKKGSKWPTIPQLMLMYRAAAWLVRTHAPEISMGLQTAEEVGDVYDAKKGRDGQYAVTLDTLREDVDASLAAAPANVDRTTGEVIENETSGQQSTGQQSTTETTTEASRTEVSSGFAVKSLRDATTKADLTKAWKEIKAAYKAQGQTPPLDVETVYTDRLAELE